MAIYTCQSCSFSGTLVEAAVHNRSEHVSDRQSACFICSERVNKIRRHIRRHHPTHCTVWCPTCKEPFVADDDMRHHFNMGCKTVKKPRPSKKKHGSRSHWQRARQPRVWPCDQCSKRLRTEQGVKSHKEAVHGSSAHGTSPYTRGPSTPPASFTEFLDHCKPADINRYISQHLQTDEEFRDESSSVVDHLADFFKRRLLFTVIRFIKGGSLGKGTALKSKSDIDLVMFISELPSIDSPGYHRQLQDCLDQMDKTLRTSRQSIAYDLEVLDCTTHAVKLRVKTHKRDHASYDVDLLPTTDILGPTPTPVKKAEVYDMMGRMGPRARENCSAALVELQRDFVKQQPAEMKDLIRLVKMWKKSCVAESSLTSYPLELLCIHIWPYHYSVADAFKAVLRNLSDYDGICAYWTDNYSYDRVVPMLAKRPLILDPANPYNNVADRCRKWDAVARAARETLKKSFFGY